jgi:AraC-like DNA-binding protein
VYRENDNLKDKRPVQEFCGLASPVMGVEIASYADATLGDCHCHPQAELLYAETGAVRIATAKAEWIVPPHRAAWFPSDCEHQADTLGPAQVCRVYIHPSSCPTHAPQTPCLLPVSPLLRELARRASALGANYDPQGRDGRLMALLLDELDWTPAPDIAMPRFRDLRVLAVAQAFASNPGDTRTLAEWATFAGASVRTLARLFEREGGMTFRQWREQFRVLAAIPRLMGGDSVTILASDLGYETPGAFATMFRRVTGMAPSQYLAATGEKQASSMRRCV